MSKRASKVSGRYYFHIMVMLVLYFGFGFIKPIGQITEVGMGVLGVFFGLIYAWLFIDMLWPSFLGLVALGLTGYCNVTNAFIAGFGNNTFLQIFFFFILAAYAEHSGLSRKIGYWFLSRKAIEGRPWLFVTLIFAAAYVLGIFVMMYAIIFIMWSIFYSICEIVNLRKGDKTAAYIMVGILQSATLSGLIMPYQAAPAISLNALYSATGLSIPTGSYMLYMAVISLLSVVAYLLLGKLLKVDVSCFAHLKVEQIIGNEKIGFEREQKIAMLILCGFVAATLLPSLAPEGSFVASVYQQAGDFGILLTALMVVFALKLHDGTLADFTTLAKQGLNWELLALVAATCAVGGAMTHESTGVVAWITSMLMPIFDGVGTVLFLICAFVLLALITQVAHNIILIITFVPLLASLALNLDMGVSVALIITAGLTFVLMNALVTPAASNRGAMIYGNDWIGKKWAFAFGTAAVVCSDLAVVLIGIPLGLLVW